MDMLCLMHDGTPYGYLKVGSKVILPINLSRMIGATLSETEGYLDELSEAGVFSKSDEETIFSRRMIRDEEIRTKRAAGGIKGGNPALKTAKPKVNHFPTPSSSSSPSGIPQSPTTPTPASPSSESGKKEKDVIPKSPEALAICELFGRRPTTEWDPKLVRKFKDGVRRGVITLESVSRISRYYIAERQKGEEGRQRRDIGTFVNNFDGELDRAEAFLASAQNGNGHAAPKPLATDERWLPFLESINRPAEWEFHRAPEFLRKDFEKWKAANPSPA